MYSIPKLTQYVVSCRFSARVHWVRTKLSHAFYHIKLNLQIIRPTNPRPVYHGFAIEPYFSL